MRTKHENRCSRCGRKESRVDANIEFFLCEACGSRLSNSYYVKDSYMEMKAASDIKKLEEKIDQVPSDTMKLIKAERQKEKSMYILMRILITIIGGLILQFIIRYIWF